MISNDIKAVFTMEELAKYLSTSRDSLYKNFRKQHIPFFKIYDGQRGIRFRTDKVKEWIDKKTIDYKNKNA